MNVCLDHQILLRKLIIKYSWLLLATKSRAGRMHGERRIQQWKIVAKAASALTGLPHGKTH
jgi:hypothetical protein